MPETALRTAADLLYSWGDAIWLAAVPLCVHRPQRLRAWGFVLICMIAVRLQTEIVRLTGYDAGILGLWSWDIFLRGFLVYGLAIALFLGLSRLSPGISAAVHLAVSLTLFFAAFVAASIAMVL